MWRMIAVPVAVFALISGCADPVTPPKPKQDSGCATAENGADPLAPRPKVPGRFVLIARERKPDGEKGKSLLPTEKRVEWVASETAIIICDMWDDHYCKSSAQRVGVLVPKMNEVVSRAREHGAQIIHAPSGTVDIYADTAFRKRAIHAKASTPPKPLKPWCYEDPNREPPLPVETAKCACDDPVVGAYVRKYTRQHVGLDIAGYDAVSDNGAEIYNLLKQEGIKNVAVMGVHTNMCVLGRPFGIRQLVMMGFNVVLVRDLTDAMYDPRQPPFVSHARGTELVIEHIESYWCPSIRGTDLTATMDANPKP